MTPPRSRLRQVIALATPITLGNLSQTLVSLVDTLMVSSLGEVPLGGLGAAAVLFLVLFLSFTGLYQGVQVLSARRVGEGRPERAGRILQNGLLLGLALGALSTATGLVLPDLLAPVLTGDLAAGPGATSRVAADAAEAARWGGASTSEVAAGYLHWRWGGGLWLVILLFVFKGFFWGVGITRLDWMVGVVVNLLNIVFNWLLIFGNLGCPRMGAPGAGLASALATGIALLLYALVAASPAMRREYGSFTAFRFRPRLALRILRLSVPRSIQGLAFGASVVFFGIVGHVVGPQGLAASTVIWRVFGILVLIGVGIGTAAATLVSREMGRKDPESAARYGWTAGGTAVGLGIVAGLLGCVFARPILRLFDLEPDTLEEALPVFRMILLLHPLDVLGIVLSRSLAGAGDVVFVMLAEVVSSWVICIPAAFLFHSLLADQAPLLGVWCGWAAYMSSWGLIMTWRWRRGRWRRIRL